jgi:hypothetical protein
MTTTKELICFNCIHFHVTGVGCDAFPDGIPDQILLTNRHSKPIHNQENNIVFEKETEEE